MLGKDEYTLSPAQTIQEDLERRDLTINSLALDQKGNLYAHPLALADLKNKILRPISLKNFLSDPLRIFRAARFAAQWPDFSPHPSLLEISKKTARATQLGNIAPERITQELIKALDSPLPSRFFHFLDQSLALSPWFKELSISKDIPSGPREFHPEPALFDHLLKTMDTLACYPSPERQTKSNCPADTPKTRSQPAHSSLNKKSILVWMGLCHDLGKIMTPAEQWPRHIGHDIRSAEVINTIWKRLRLSKKYLAAGRVAGRWHMVGARYTTLRPGKKVDLLTLLESKGFLEDFFALVKADHQIELLDQAQRDLRIIQTVHVPENCPYTGADIGQHLRALRAQALSQG